MTRFELPHGFREGDFVLVSEPGPTRGLGRIEDFVDMKGEPFVRIRLASRVLALSEELARRSLTPPMALEDAEAMLDRLTFRSAKGDERPKDDQHITSIKTLSKGSWIEIEQRLATLYASRWKPTYGGKRMLVMYEMTLMPILAHALGRDEKALTEDIRKGKPVFSATDERPEVPVPGAPDAAPIRGLEALYQFDLDGEVWIGERVDWHADSNNGLARLEVAPGRWHSYRRLHEDDEEPIELLLVHDSALRDVAAAQWRKAAQVTSVIGSGQVDVVDRTALADADTMDRVRYLSGVNAYGGHAMCVATTDGWDGPLPVFVSPPHGAPTMIRIPLCDDEDL